jgi:cell division protease FtsH
MTAPRPPGAPARWAGPWWSGNAGPLVAAVALLVLLALVRGWWGAPSAVRRVPYSAIEQALADGRVAEVTLGDTLVTARLKVPESDGAAVLESTLVEPALAERIGRYGVPYLRVRESTWLPTVLAWIVPVAVMLLMWRGMARGMRGLGAGALDIGQSKARLYMQASTGVRFADVAGVDEAKAELQEIVDFLKDPKEHGRLGARMPRGILLMGPTGTGKTLLARAVAGEAGVPFFSISGSEFIELFVGVGAARVRDLFEQARGNAPAIIFIDELDALGRTRGAAALSGGHDEREQTLNQLLVELDGFDPSVGVILLAATNRPEVLDPALLRAGRFDRQVLVDRPDRVGRAAILRVHAAKIRLAAGVDLDQVAAITIGFAGADLANVVNEAALVATRRRGDDVTLDDFTRAIERIVAGIEKPRSLLGADERRTVATHELGHALTALALRSSERVHKVSIVPRGVGALGYTLQRPSEDRHLLRRSELFARIAVLMGGRAAETLVFGEPSTGAADDIAKATDLARDLVMRYGMDDGIGPVAYTDQAPRFLQAPFGTEAPRAVGPETAQAIDAAVRRVLDEADGRARDVLALNRALLDRAVALLLEHETLDEVDLAPLAAELSVPGGAPRGAAGGPTG